MKHNAQLGAETKFNLLDVLSIYFSGTEKLPALFLSEKSNHIDYI
jgi:hypothetical protein